MVTLFEFYLSLLRIIILVLGVTLVFFLSTHSLIAINQILHGANLPCLEIISFLIAVVPPIMIFYGIKEQKFFWHKTRQVNLTIFVISFFVGAVISFFPSDLIHAFVNLPSTYCMPPQDPLEKIYHVLGTGLVTALFAFLGLDIGASLKHVSHRIVSPHRKHAVKKTTSKKKKKR